MEETLIVSGEKDFRSIRELNLILSISHRIINTLNYDEVLQLISDGISELLEIETAAIYMLEENGEIILAATTPPLDPNMPDGLRKSYLKEHPNMQEVVLNKRSLLVPDMTMINLSPAEKVAVEMRKLRSLIFLPFIRENKVLGVLILGTCNKSRKYTDHEIELGQMVANQLSVAIQNSRLHEDLKKHKENLEKLVIERTQALKTTNEELTAINEELNEKNNIVIEQKEELESTLVNLKAMQVKLIQSEKMASLGILTAGVAHEINNPLNFIMCATQGLEDFFETLAPQHKDHVSVLLNALKTGVNRTADIVNGLNQFSRDNDTYNEDCEIHSIIENCLTMLLNKYKNRISIIKNFNFDNLIVKGNVGKMHQAILNILTNSIQAIEDKGIITISTEKTRNTIKIIIEDTGCGIEKKNLDKIFDPFYTTKDPGKGTGLGLSIVYNIIKAHKGQIEFESKKSLGVKATITLPVK